MIEAWLFNEAGDHEPEERSTLDKHRENDARSLDVRSGFRLTSHRLGHMATNFSDTEPGAENGDSRPDHPTWAASWDSMRVEYGTLTGVEVQ